MKIEEKNGKWQIVHDNRVVKQKFDTEDQAWSWADRNIDDQVFDKPNCMSDPIVYE